MKKFLIIGVLGVLIAVAIGYAVSENPVKKTSDLQIPTLETQVLPGDAERIFPPVEESLPTPTKQDSAPPAPDTLPVSVSGEYAEYNEALIKQKLAEGKRVVLFFYAAWCPTCRLADESIRKALNDIPADVAILKVDYDREKDLKSTYGVSYQHTFVQITEDLSSVTTFQGSSTLPAILANIQ